MATIRPMRNGRLAMLACACLFAASSATAEQTGREPLWVWAIGLPNGYVIMEHQIPALQVSAQDVERGYVDVREGSRLTVVLRSPGAYAVDFRSVGKTVRDARIGGVGDEIEIDLGGGTAVQPQARAGRHSVAIDYRFKLVPGTAPGTYAWPLALAVRAPLPGEGARSVAAFRLATTGQ